MKKITLARRMAEYVHQSPAGGFPVDAIAVVRHRDQQTGFESLFAAMVEH
nr:hypothetical protein [Pseudomonas sp. ALS1279]